MSSTADVSALFLKIESILDETNDAQQHESIACALYEIENISRPQMLFFFVTDIDRLRKIVTKLHNASESLNHPDIIPSIILDLGKMSNEDLLREHEQNLCLDKIRDEVASAVKIGDIESLEKLANVYGPYMKGKQLDNCLHLVDQFKAGKANAIARILVERLSAAPVNTEYNPDQEYGPTYTFICSKAFDYLFDNDIISYDQSRESLEELKLAISKGCLANVKKVVERQIALKYFGFEIIRILQLGLNNGEPEFLYNCVRVLVMVGIFGTDISYHHNIQLVHVLANIVEYLDEEQIDSMFQFIHQDGRANFNLKKWDGSYPMDMIFRVLSSEVNLRKREIALSWMILCGADAEDTGNQELIEECKRIRTELNL